MKNMHRKNTSMGEIHSQAHGKYTHKRYRLAWLICEVHIVQWKEHIHYNVKYPSCWEKVSPLGLGLDRQYGPPSHTPMTTLVRRGKIVGDGDESGALKHCKCGGGEDLRGKSSNSKQRRGNGGRIRPCLTQSFSKLSIFFVCPNLNAFMGIHHCNAVSYKCEGHNRCHVIHEVAMMPRSL